MSKSRNYTRPEGPVHTLRGHEDVILRLSWSSDGRSLVSTSVDRTIRLWDWEHEALQTTLSGHSQGVNEVAWATNGHWLASCSFDRTVRIWNLETGNTIRELHGHLGDVSSISIAPAGDHLVSASADKTLRVWRTDTWEAIKVLTSHTDNVYRVLWSPRGDQFASCSKDGMTILWDAATLEPKCRNVLTAHRSRPSSVIWSPSGRCLCITRFDGTVSIWLNSQDISVPSMDLTHHSNIVRSGTFSHDERLLATSSVDGTVRLWRTDTWEPVGQFDEPTANYWPQGISFHPTRPILATFGEHDRVIRIWHLNIDELLGKGPREDEHTYRNAKVVLLGETGVGKSALALVLTGSPYVPTDSTYGRRVWAFGLEDRRIDGQRETRETLLWDMAGQPGYRLIHQLHLSEVVVAILVFDARQATGDPLASVRHWDRALRQAQQREGAHAFPLRRFLVYGRADIQRVPLTPDGINTLRQDWQLDGFFETSAREGWGIPELRHAIEEAIDWNLLPRVKSPDYFTRVKEFILEEKSSGRKIATLADLYRTFALKFPQNTHPDTRGVFDVSITRLENRDLVRRLSFGGLVLLQPELLDNYASAIIQSAEAVGMSSSGSVAQADLLEGRFTMPASERLDERPLEKLLVVATIEEFLDHQLALRDGDYLVFPSQFMSELTEDNNLGAPSISVTFEGPVRNVYATLVVRLANSGEFRIDRKDMWKNAAVFSADTGGESILDLRESPDGRGKLSVFFRADSNGRNVDAHAQYHFEAFLLSHLEKRALIGSVKLTRHFQCPVCKTEIPPPYVEALRARGEETYLCPIDRVSISLVEPLKQIATQNDVSRMEAMADRARDRGVSEVVLMGKEQVGQYDVFLCYNRQDAEAVLRIYDQLLEHGVRPWLDTVQRPGNIWLNEIDKLIGSVKAAAIFVGTGGTGRVQNMEINLLLRTFANGGVRIIPVLLPGASKRPDWSAFLDDFQWVDFQKGAPEPLSQLLYGITGIHTQ